jgi:hypothetical protein
VRRLEWDAWSDILCETEHLRNIWKMVAEAASEDQCWIYRRRALHQLRETIREDAYYSGQLPPCAPLWRFGQE